MAFPSGNRVRLAEEDSAFAGPASGAPVAPVIPRVNRTTPVPTIPAGASNPDYGALIKSDPGYMSYLNSGKLDIEQAGSARRAALQRLAIQYGGLPKGMRDQFGDIDANTLDLAGRNQFSDSANLKRQYASGIEGFKRSLAARGVLQSGELGYGLEQAEYGRGQREYDLGNNFANAAQGVVNDYLSTEGRVRSGEAGALSAAQQSVYSNPVNRPVDAVDIPLEAGSVEQYGQGVYRHPDGRRFTADGQPFSEPPARQAPQPDLYAGQDQPNMIWIQDENGQLRQVPAGYRQSGYAVS